jgi:signal transduction histidine kinase/ligand-binding sensor domain-containing protein
VAETRPSSHLGDFPASEALVADRFRTFAIVLLSALVPARPAAAQQARPLLDPPAFQLDQWTTAEGLPQNSVTAIAQAPEGHLWIGTFGGLARFDGASFRLIERSDSLGRHVDRILSLAVGPDSALWIGTEESGLLRYHRGAFDRFTVEHGLPGHTIRALYVDRAGTLWVGAENGGIAHLAGGRFERIAEAEGRPLGLILSFAEDGEGTLWVNTGDRFVTVEDGVASPARWRRFPLAGAERYGLEDRAGGQWFGLTRGVARISAGAVRGFGAADGIPGNAALMAEDPGGGFWLGTDNDGLFFFQPDAAGELIRRYPLPDGQQDYRVRAALVDLEGNVWFGTNANGLIRAKRNVFTTYTSAQGLSHDVATAVFADAAGVVWAATNCWGLNALDPARRTVRLFKPRKPGDPTGDPCVFALTESPPGTMWVGTYGGGLTRVSRGHEDRLSAGLSDSVILALFTDRDGSVWVGTNRGGLAVLENGRVRASYTTQDGLAHNSVRTIHQTRDGALWIGTLEGLSRLAGGRFTSYTAADGLSAGHVRAIHEDAAGNLWIGTYGGGLNRLRDGALTAVRKADGLADDIVSAILEDDRGYFWMSGNRGIYRVARAELEEFADGRRRRVHSVLYGVTDGLLNAETNGGFQPAGCKDARGRLWFPTVQGVAMVDPARVSVAERPPPVTVEEVVVDGEPRPAAERLVVGPGRPNLEFRYAGLSLSAPEHLVFRYRLEGFDQDWVEAGTRRVAYYPRLPPGRYRFSVTAANRDGRWSQAAGVGLRVTAPFWMAWWFRTGAALALVGLLLAAMRRREVAIRRSRAAQEEFSRRLIESQEHERKRIAGELHDGLGQELLVVKNRALLALQAEGLHRPVREQLKHITDVATQSLESVRSLAHHLTPRHLDHLGLTAALRSMVAVTAESAGITLRVNVDDVDGLLPVDRQIDLYRVVQEGLSNVVHHAAARNATVHIRRAGSQLRVTIVDDGRGFQVRRDDRGRLTGGFGLTGIAERVRMLEGRIEVSSAPGRGTVLEVTIPVSRAVEIRGA